MKKPKPKNKTAPWHTFPQNIKEWTDEDHALGWLVRGLRFTPRSSSQPHFNVFPFPAFYVPSMERFFEWFAGEISEKENQDAAERLYYLALLSVRNLLAACEARPDLYRPIAKHQLYWPSMTGWGADVERTNKELMAALNLGETIPCAGQAGDNASHARTVRQPCLPIPSPAFVNPGCQIPVV